MTQYKTLNDLPDVSGKTILLRADLNVPRNSDGKITDYTRIKRLEPTILDLISKGANIKILSHFGRPKGKQDHLHLSTRPLARELSQTWGKPVSFENGENITLLENTRFHPGEESNDKELAQSWADQADIYVNDCLLYTSDAADD